ncbi:MAG: C10 family peptidase [Muribaculaceae bacterium]|nr:C10 family peptidase [Muribaculaceae bacterium]
MKLTLPSYSAVGVALMAALTLPQPLLARQLTVKEAVKAADVEAASTPGLKGLSAASGSYRLLNTQRYSDLNTVYIIEPKGSGEVYFLAADDVARPVLGWTDGATFSIDNIPPAFRYMLDCYSQEIAAASQADAPEYNAASRSGLSDVAPLVSTRWNQDAPYNNLCPTISGKATYTGCVATAMSQVMNFHKWPLTGTGSNTYEWANNGNQKLTFDFSTVSFDWSNMLDSYSSGSTAAQNTAVATLMKACGYSVDMNYGTGASGAFSFRVAQALIDNFGYAKSLYYMDRMLYPLDTWIEMIHNELANRRPVYYSGANPSGGHAFVLDGYRSGDYFHVNWGWGGSSNGYFAITALDPANQGIGGSAAGYNQSQAAVFGVEKDYSGSQYHVAAYTQGTFVTGQTTYSRSESVVFGSGDTWFIGSYTIEPVTGQFGVRLTNISSGAETDLFNTAVYSSLQFRYGIKQFGISASSFPTSGEYYVEPIAKINGTVMKALVPQNKVNKLRLTASASQLVFVAVEDNVTISATAPVQEGKCYAGSAMSVSSTLTATGGEYFGDIKAVLYKGTTSMAQSDAIPIDILAGNPLELTWSIPTTSVAAGTYTVKIIDAGGSAISPATTVTVLAKPTGTPSLSIRSINCVSQSGNGTQDSPWVVPKDQIDISVEVYNASGLFENSVGGFVFPASGGNSLVYLGAQKALLGPGESQVINLSASLSALTPETPYMLYFTYIDNNAWSFLYPAYFIRPSASAGIEGIGSDESATSVVLTPAGMLTVSSKAGIRAVTVAAVSGAVVAEAGYPGVIAEAEMDLSHLPAGVYVAKVTTADGRTAVSKIAKH